ncbi:MAG: mechanosensitive ion channel family protein [Treponema sp.]|jgi:small-conductance mechanosensitive channel|nr:mechanosensitive ion channel family protein [Treponema sp.]
MELNIYLRLLIAFAIITGQILLIWFVWFMFKLLDKKLEHTKKHKIKHFRIKKITLLTAKQVVGLIEYILRIIRYLITVIILYLTIPIIFSLFPATRHHSYALINYVLNPLRDIGIGILHFIPNLIKIIIIITIIRLALKALRFFSRRIEKGKIVIPHFYSEWAAPTFKILQVLLWAFTIVLVYPYLPGSDSRIFQGVSVFIGIVFSISSTSAIGNLIAGLVITYMRPFKIGDRIKINEEIGFVVEKNLMVVKIKTHKNEYITFPNLVILNSSTVNYNTSSDENEEGLIIYAEVTFGYSTPWQTVHDILIKAAVNTGYVLENPKPFVLQTKLDDFYACYQINCYTKEISKVPVIYTMLYENIQNGFLEKGLDMTSAHYRVIAKIDGK